MKKSILIIILTLFCITESKSQDPILDGLNDPNIFKRENALSNIRQYNLEEYIPVLVELTFEQSEPVMIKNFMKTLAYLNYDEIGEIAYQFIEIAEEFEDMFPSADPLEMKVIATEILFNIEDYSTVNYLFELAKREYPFNQRSRLITISMLGRVINELPAFEEDAKEILLQSVINSPNGRVRSIALSALFEKYGSELIGNYVDISKFDDDWTMRNLGLEILHEINYLQLNDLLRERITVDVQPEIRDWIADYLLTWFGEPSDLKYLQDYLPNETDQTTALEISIEIATFIPPRPTDSTYAMMKNIESYVEEMFQYGWITERWAYMELLGYTDQLRRAYKKGDKANLCQTINSLLEYTENLYPLIISEEAYKFLYYHGTYIKENIEDEFGECQ